MDTLSPGDDFAHLVAIVWSPIGLGTIGMVFDVLALIVLASDISRVHTEIRNEKIGGVGEAELRLRRALADKSNDIAKFDEAASRGAPIPVDTEWLHREIKQMMNWHQMQIELVDAVRVYQGLSGKISTGKSVTAVWIATVLFVLGIGFQVVAQLRSQG